MNIQLILFFVLAAIAAVTSVMVITRKNAVLSAVFFVLMLLNTETEHGLFVDKRGIKFFAILISAFVFVQLAFLIFKGNPSRTLTADEAASINAGTIQTIGHHLYTDYIIPFEVAGFLLLAATIGALVLAKKKFE